MFARGLKIVPLLFIGILVVQPRGTEAEPSDCRGMVAATNAIAALYIQNPSQPPSLQAVIDALYPHRMDLTQEQRMKLLADVYTNFRIQTLPHDQQMLFNTFTTRFLSDESPPKPAEKPKLTTRKTKELSPANLVQALDSITEPTLIFLVTPGCPHCERMKKEWDAEASRAIAEGKRVAQMIYVELRDDAETRALLTRSVFNQFDGFPAFVMLSSGRITGSQGARDGKIKELLSRLEN